MGLLLIRPIADAELVELAAGLEAVEASFFCVDFLGHGFEHGAGTGDAGGLFFGVGRTGTRT